MTAEQLQALADLNISLLVSCIEPEQAPPAHLYPDSLRSLRIAWEDFGTPTFEQMVCESVCVSVDESTRDRSIATTASPAEHNLCVSCQQDHWIEQASIEIAQGRAVACHCYAGIGRTGTALASYLVKQHQLSPVACVSLSSSFSRSLARLTDRLVDCRLTTEPSGSSVQFDPRASMLATKSSLCSTTTTTSTLTAPSHTIGPCCVQPGELLLFEPSPPVLPLSLCRPTRVKPRLP